MGFEILRVRVDICMLAEEMQGRVLELGGYGIGGSGIAFGCGWMCLEV